MKTFIVLLATALFSSIAFPGNAKDALLDYVNDVFEPVPAAEASYQRTAAMDEDGTYVVNILFLDGTKRMTGRYTSEFFEVEDGWFEFYFYAGHKESEGLFENGQKVGTWKRWDWTGASLRDRHYAAPRAEQPVIVNSRSEFPGGEAEMFQFIDQHLADPAVQTNVQGGGYVEVCFTIDLNGALQNIQILKSNNDYLAIEAERLVANMPSWMPAIEEGSPVESLFILPILVSRKEVVGKF